MTGDLVKRLRSVDVSWSETGEWCAEAADRIEALEAALEQRERETVERIVAWLTGGIMFAAADYEIAKAIEAGEHLK